MKYTTALLTLSSLAAAAPSTTASKKSQGQKQVAQFDNISGLPAVAASPINIYQSIYWNGLSLVQTLNLGVEPGVVPQSPNNYAAFSALDVATVAQGQPAMQVNFEDSTTGWFDLDSFYYGCAAATEASLVGLPKACTITVKGYADEEATDLIGHRTFNFKPSGLRVNMVEAKSVGLKGVKKVEFFVSDDATTAGLVDTVGYTTYAA